MKNKDTTPYVVVAKAFGNDETEISSPMDKDNADALAAKLKDAMDKIESEFKAYDNIKVKKYDLMDLFPSKEKNDPYDYSVLDGLDKLISKDIGKDTDFIVKDEQGKVEK